MKRVYLILIIPILHVMVQCKQVETDNQKIIPQVEVEKAIKALVEKHGEQARFRAERGVKQVSNLWRNSDGTAEEFYAFTQEQFISDEKSVETLFQKLSAAFEILNGYFLRINKDLNKPLHLDMGEITPIDMLFGGFNASAHLAEDLFSNKIAFVTALNFPNYSLKEKTELGLNWTRKEWAYARMGDVFLSRVPANLNQKYSEVQTNADTYINEYNIYLDKLRNDKSEQLFPNDLKLITHWGLRDELKTQYADKENGIEKQRIIYQVMKRIIDQSIPQKVINSNEYQWNPYTNETYKGATKVELKPEPDTRYQQTVNLFKVLSEIDAYHPTMPNFIQRTFEGTYEIPVDDVEKLFIDFVSSPQVREVGKLINQRLGRPLEPFDIWYDGFKARSSISGEQLDATVGRRFKSTSDFEQEIPKILTSLGWKQDKANFIASKIQVEGSRGPGHAWGGEMRSDVALLRTRIGSNGMDYKGFNIAMHEFGHTVEQNITLHDVDYYMLHGIPNTAFTEAIAFLFQKRDLDVLDIKDNSPERMKWIALDNLWSCYEIMGVSLVDINLWKWLYNNPNADAQQVKEAVIKISKEVWNKYYADVFEVTDEPILAIYSHMIDNPLYLSAYPLGHLIDFQLEQQIEGKVFADEVQRIYQQGRIIPQLWMKGAVGQPLSNEPTLKAGKEAVDAVRIPRD